MTLRDALERLRSKGVQYVEAGPAGEIVGAEVHTGDETVGGLTEAAKQGLRDAERRHVGRAGRTGRRVKRIPL